MKATLAQFLSAPGDSVREVMTRIDRGARGIALIVDDHRRLIGTITDGDLRRAILSGLNLELPITELLARKTHPLYARPFTARLGTPMAQLLTEAAAQEIMPDYTGKLLAVFEATEQQHKSPASLPVVMQPGSRLGCHTQHEGNESQ